MDWSWSAELRIVDPGILAVGAGAVLAAGAVGGVGLLEVRAGGGEGVRIRGTVLHVAL